MYSLNDICVYIFNWKKVTQNSLLLYEKIHSIIENTCIINCDENTPFEDSIKHIQLDDSHYYGSQFKHSINDISDNHIFCVVVGDNIPDNDFEKIFQSAINIFNQYKVGVYAPNDKRSDHKSRNHLIQNELYDVNNTDCGFWFIHPTLLEKLKKIDYSLSKYGWGIDSIAIEEARKKDLLVIRDYSIETDQLDRNCGYNWQEAHIHFHKIVEQYRSLQ